MNNIVSIIIPCRNEVRNIEETVHNIQLQNYPQGELDIIIVDGLSDDGTIDKINELSKQYPNLRLIENERKITPVAFNLGIKAAKGDYILIVGARQVISSDYVRNAVAALEEEEQLVCVGGKVTNVYDRKEGELISIAMSSGFGVGIGNFRVETTDKYVDTVGTPCYKKWIFEKVGLFDEELIRNQDDDLNYRVIQQGYKIKLLHKIEVKYYVRANTSKLAQQMFQYGYWKVYVNKKHKAITTFRQLIPAMFVIYLFFLPFSVILGKYILIPLSMLLAYCVLGFFAFRNVHPINSRLVVQLITFKMHFYYGLGYLKGITDFIILNRKPSSKQAILTR